jgi:hypothetical protein
MRSINLYFSQSTKFIFGEDALLSALNNTTSILDQVDAPHARTCDMQQMIQQAISAYDTLLFFPIEYLSRTSRTDFVRRALTADVVVSNVPVGEGSLESYCRSLTVLRTFVKRVFAYLGAVDLPVRPIPISYYYISFPLQVQTVHKFLEHILNTVDSLTTELLLVTLDLIEILYV